MWQKRLRLASLKSDEKIADFMISVLEENTHAENDNNHLLEELYFKAEFDKYISKAKQYFFKKDTLNLQPSEQLSFGPYLTALTLFDDKISEKSKYYQYIIGLINS